MKTVISLKMVVFALQKSHNKSLLSESLAALALRKARRYVPENFKY